MKRFGAIAWFGLALLCLGWVLAAPAAHAANPLAVSRLRLMSYNIRGGSDEKKHKAYPAILAVIRKQRPDIVVILETGPMNLSSASGVLGLPHHVLYTRAYSDRYKSSGIAIFSRWPLKSELMDLKGVKKTRRFIRAWVDVSGLPLSLYAVHLSREGLLDKKGKGLLLEMLGQGSRMEQMEGLVKVVKDDKCTFKILAGDLNTFAPSGPYRLLSNTLEDAFPSSISGPGTYRTKGGRPSPKIDHIFHSPALKVLKAFVVQEGPSDHFPVVADFSIPPSPDRSLPKKKIQLAQSMLVARKFFPGNMDGYLDPRTRVAIAQFQFSNGLKVDGRLNRKTLQLLLTGKR